MQRELLLYERMKYVVSAKNYYVVHVLVYLYYNIIIAGGKIRTHNIISEPSRVPSKTKPSQSRCESIIK